MLTTPSGNVATYRSLPIEVDVETAAFAGVVHTLEGSQEYVAGDAIITGTQGERWPVRAAEFARRYEPVEGRDGRYRKRPLQVCAGQVRQGGIVRAPSGAVLQASPDSWVVYGEDGAVSVVDARIFARTYALSTVPVYIGLSETLVPAEVDIARRGLVNLQSLLPATRLVIVEDDDLVPPPLWLIIVSDHAVPSPDTSTLALPLSAIGSEVSALHLLIAQERRESAWSFTWHYATRGLRRLLRRESRVPAVAKLASARLCAIEAYNSSLSHSAAGGTFHRRCHEPPTKAKLAAAVEEPLGLQRLHEFASVADAQASRHQRNWQEAVFARTSLIANAVCQKTSPLSPAMPRPWLSRWMAVLRLFAYPSLVTLGLLAALGFATFSELTSAFGETNDWWKHRFEPGVFLFVYAAPLGIAWWRFARTKARRDEARHQDLRLLAECLRARYVRALLGEPACVSTYVFTDAASESYWVRDALQSLHHAQPIVLIHSVTAAEVERVRQDFVGEQLVYHQDRLLSSRRDASALLARMGSRGMILFLLALAAMIADELSELLRGEPLVSPEFPHVLTSLMIVALAFWGSMRRLIDVLGLEDDIERGETVAAALDLAKDGDRAGILIAVDAFAKDQGHWHLLHRGKSIEAATGA